MGTMMYSQSSAEIHTVKTYIQVSSTIHMRGKDLLHSKSRLYLPPAFTNLVWPSIIFSHTILETSISSLYQSIEKKYFIQLNTLGQITTNVCFKFQPAVMMWLLAALRIGWALVHIYIRTTRLDVLGA